MIWKYIKKLKKFIFTDLGKGIIKVIFGQGSGSIINIINMVLLVNILGLEKNGIIFLALNYSSLFDTFFNFQSYQALIKYIPIFSNKNKLKIKNYIYQAIMIDLLTAILAFICSIIFLPIIAKYFEWDVNQIKIIKMATILIILNIVSVPIGIFRVYKAFNTLSFLNLLNPTINLILNLILYFLCFSTMEAFVLAMIVSKFIFLIFNWLEAIKILKEKDIFSFKIKNLKFEKDFFKFLLMTNLNSSLEIPVHYLTTFFLGKFLGMVDLAVFKIIEKLGNTIKMFAMVLVQLLSPEISYSLAQNDKKKAYKIVRNMAMTISVLGGIGILLFCLTYKYWLNIFIFNYNKYLSVILLFLIYIIFTQAISLVHSLFIFSGYLKLNILITLISNIIYIFSLYIGLKHFELKGVIFSLIIQSSLLLGSKIIILKIGEKNYDRIT